MSIGAKGLFAVSNAITAAARAISTYVVVPALRKASKVKASAHTAAIASASKGIAKEIAWQNVLQQDLSVSYEDLYNKRKAYKAAVAAESDFYATRVI